MKLYYENKNEFNKVIKPGELQYLRGSAYRYLNQEGTRFYYYTLSSNLFHTYAVTKNLEFPELKDLLPKYRYPLKTPSSLQNESIYLTASEASEAEKQTIVMLITAEDKNRRSAVHILAQGSRTPKCNLNKLPMDLLGEIASGFFYSTASKLTAKLEKLNEQANYGGFKSGFLLGKRF